MKISIVKQFMITLALVTGSFVNAQTIIIDSTFSVDGEIYPFDTTQAIYGLTVDCSVQLNSDTSLVRIIMVDSNYNEYMLYEAYPLIVSNDTIIVEDTCDETCYLDGVLPYLLEVQIINSTLELDTLNLRINYTDNADSLRIISKQQVELSKTNKINSYIQENNMIWFADRNPVSNMGYSEKKSLFGEKYNSQGIEYYMGGIYSRKSDSILPTDNSSLNPEWDWRNRHGANDPGKQNYYFDGDNIGWTGWITPVQNQNSFECDGLCYIYGPLGGLESVANLYFNHHVDYALSVQHILDCDGYTGDYSFPTDCDGGYGSITHNFIRDYGIVDSLCYPRGYGSSGVCKDPNFPNGSPSYRITFPGVTSIQVNSSSPDSILKIKKNLIQHGPIKTIHDDFAGTEYSHYMSLVGYGRIDDGDTLYFTHSNGNTQKVIITQFNHPEWIGRTYWIYKNSWGIENGYYGFLYYINDVSKPSYLAYYNLPIDDLLSNNDKKKYFDKDRDGYWYWGLGSRPDSCPNTLPDGDDSEPRLGPFDTNYYCTSIAPDLEVYYKIDTNTKQRIYTGDTLFVSRYSIETDFVIENTGDAQLNLISWPIAFWGDMASHFSYTCPDERYVEMNGGNWDFTVNYDNSPNPAFVDIEIKINEPDIDDFPFTLVLGSCSSLSDNIIIDSDSIWENANVITSNVYVCDSSTLTIRNTSYFNSMSSLIIGQGSRVIVEDGGLLTKLCGSPWKGIDIIGYDTSQAFESYHGVLQVDEGGIIEFAEIGAETVGLRQKEDVNGGIIKSDGGIFRNNIVDVLFREFQNTHPVYSSQLRDNVSGFTSCEFVTDSNMYKAGFEPEAHILLQGANGVHFTSCTFHNTHQPANENEILGKGIRSLDTKYYVSSACFLSDPSTGECLEYDSTLFKGLDYGIYAGNGRSNQAPLIEITKFENNKTGIYLSQTPQASVTLCDFDIKKMNYNPLANEIYTGIYVNSGCDGFELEENYFYNSDSDPFGGSDSTIGIVVNNSGAVSNEVYNNYFEDLDFGVSAQGTNKGDSVGLLIRCNDFDSCQFDIVVVPEDAIGIAQNQGTGSNIDPENMAGNLFYIPDDSPDWDYDDIDNEGELINYYYPGNPFGYEDRIEPIDIDTVLTKTKNVIYPDPGWLFDQGCPSYLEQSDSLDELRSEMMMTEHRIDSTKIFLNSLIDGGETAELQEDVEYSNPPESMEIYNELMNESPYLSDTVVSTAIEIEDVLPNAMIRDVMVANPNTAKSNKLMAKLDDRFDPMPDYMKSQILQGKSILSIREETEADLAMLQSMKAKILNAIIRYYRYDTINSSASSDSILNLYKKQNQLWSDYNLAVEYLSKNDSTNAISVLDSIPDKFILTTLQSSNHDVYEDYFDLVISLTSEGKTIYQSDSVKIAQLYTLFDESTGKINSLIRNLLIAVDSLTYDEPYYYPDIFKSTQTYEDHSRSLEKNELKYLKVFPNPANSYIIINYLYFTEKPGHIYITDLSGKLIESFYFSHGPDQKIFDMRSMKSGIYIATLIINKTYVETIKFTLIN